MTERFPQTWFAQRFRLLRIGPSGLPTVALAIVVAATGCSGQSGVSGAAASTRPAVTPSQESTPTLEPAPDPTERATPRPTPSAVARGELAVTEFGYSTWQGEFDDGARLSWAAIVENPNPTDSWVATSADVSVSFFDAGGSVVASATDTIALILPGQRAAVVGSDSPFGNPDLALIASMEVRLGEPRWEEAREALGAFTVSDVQIRYGEFGDATVTGQVASTFADEITDAYANAVYRDSAGAIVGGDFTFIDFIPPGDSIPFEISGFGSPPAATGAEVYIGFSFLSL